MAFPVGWLRKCELTINPSIASADVDGFPIYLVEDDLPSEMLDADGSNGSQADGDDVRFTSDEAGTVLLPCEILRWQLDNDPADSTVGVFVRVPEVTVGTPTIIWVWYKNASATAPAATDPEGRNAVWAGFDAVFHLEEEPADEAAIVADSAGNLTDGEFSDSGWNSGDQVEGQVSRAIEFSGGAIDFGDQGDQAGSVTLAAWVKFTDAQDDAAQTIIVKGSHDDGTANYLLGKNANNRIKFAYTDGAFVETEPPVSGLTSGAWHRVVVVARKGDAEVDFYVDGSLLGTVTDTGGLNYTTNAGPLRLGLTDTDTEPFDGLLDEVYIYAGEWDQDRVTADYRNQEGVGFVSAGTPQDGDDGDPDTIQLPPAVIRVEVLPITITSTNPNPKPGGKSVLALRMRSTGSCPDDFPFAGPPAIPVPASCSFPSGDPPAGCSANYSLASPISFGVGPYYNSCSGPPDTCPTMFSNPPDYVFYDPSHVWILDGPPLGFVPGVTDGSGYVFNSGIQLYSKAFIIEESAYFFRSYSALPEGCFWVVLFTPALSLSTGSDTYYYWVQVEGDGISPAGTYALWWAIGSKRPGGVDPPASPPQDMIEVI